VTADVVDTAAVRADDALLDALGGRDGEQPGLLVGDELNVLLLAWRHEADAKPMSLPVDTRFFTRRTR
jgi:hypothetical protein